MPWVVARGHQRDDVRCRGSQQQREDVVIAGILQPGSAQIARSIVDQDVARSVQRCTSAANRRTLVAEVTSQLNA